MKTINYEQEEHFLWIDVEDCEYKVFQETVHSWHTDLLQLDGGIFKFHLQQLILPEIQIGQAKFNAHLEHKGISPNNRWSFFLLEEKSSMFMFNNRTTLNHSTMVVFSPGDEIDGVSYHGFNVFGLSINKSYFQKLTQALYLDEIEEKLSQIDRIELDPQQSDALKHQLKDILAYTALSEGNVMTHKVKELLLHVLPKMFLKAICTKIDSTGNKIIKDKHFLFLEVRNYMHRNLEEVLNIKEISKKFNIPERTLRYYFQEELNTSPKQYLKVLRLRKIHHELKKGKKEKGLVEKTARNFGFTHMGQFSTVYKEFFGELPSETLQK